MLALHYLYLKPQGFHITYMNFTIMILAFYRDRKPKYYLQHMLSS